MNALANRVDVTKTAVSVNSLASFDAASAHTAIQAAINGADEVYIPAGDYTIGAAMTIPSKRRIIIARGAVLTLGNTVNDSMFENADQSDGNESIVMEILGTLKGNSANQGAPGSGVDGIRFVKVKTSRIFGGAAITDFKYWGIYVQDSENIDIEDVDAYDCDSGIQVANESKYCTMRRCITRGNLGSGGYGIFVSGSINTADDSTGHKIIDCRSYGNDDDNLVLFDCNNVLVDSGVYEDSVSDKGCHAQNARDCLIRDTTFRGNPLGGFLLNEAGGATVRGTKLLRVNCSENGKEGIFANGNDFTVQECKAFRNEETGIRCFYTPTNMRLVNNEVIENGVAVNHPGIELDNTTRSVIEGNRIFDARGTKKQTYGIVEAATCGNNVFRNNVIGPHLTGYKSLSGDPAATYGSDNVEIG